jgi:hypothetical protein
MGRAQAKRVRLWRSLPDQPNAMWCRKAANDVRPENTVSMLEWLHERVTQ